MNAEVAKLVVEGLTPDTTTGTSYHDALSRTEQEFFSPLSSEDSVNIAYFISDGRSYPSGNPFTYNPNDPIYNYAAMDLRRIANVQAFGIDNNTVAAGAVAP